MTRQNQKDHEKLIVEQAAAILGVSWIFQKDIESPDFIISESNHYFGLELTEIFAEINDAKKGSAKKSLESKSQRKIDRIKHEYEKKDPNKTPLDLKILGDIPKRDVDPLLNQIPDILISKGIANFPKGHREVFEIYSEKEIVKIPVLKVFATHAIRSRWYSISDRVGFLDRNPIDYIKQAISNKTTKIPQYKEKSGDDIRLLIYANRRMNSGKLMLSDDPLSLDIQGFNVVYFFSFPESVTIFRKDMLSQRFPKV